MLIGGIVRDVLGIPQDVRLLDGERVASDVLTSLRQESRWVGLGARSAATANHHCQPCRRASGARSKGVRIAVRLLIGGIVRDLRGIRTMAMLTRVGVDRNVRRKPWERT